MLVMAMGYSNNLIYLATFGLFSVAFMSMWITNENIRRVKVSEVRADGLYASEEGFVGVHLIRDGAGESIDVDVGWWVTNQKRVVSTVLSSAGEEVSIPWRPINRGHQQIPRIMISSEFPFGLLKSWKSIKTEKACIIYPSKSGDPEFPSASWVGRGDGAVGIFREHREYRNSDPIRRIDWRASSKSQTILVKNFEEAESYFEFSWQQTEHLKSFEGRLSQLCLWITRASDSGKAYRLILPNFSVEKDQGPHHLRRCLEALALAMEEDFR